MPTATAVSPALKQLLRERQRLDDEYFKLIEQGEALRNKLEGVDLAIAILKGEKAPAERAPPSVTNVKAILIDLAKEAGTTGLNSNTAVEMAAKKGIKLMRGTAASNLSRLKADNVLIHDGKKYRLPEFMPRRPNLFVSSSPDGDHSHTFIPLKGS